MSINTKNTKNTKDTKAIKAFKDILNEYRYEVEEDILDIKNIKLTTDGDYITLDFRSDPKYDDTYEIPLFDLLPDGKKDRKECLEQIRNMCLEEIIRIKNEEEGYVP